MPRSSIPADSSTPAIEWFDERGNPITAIEPTTPPEPSEAVRAAGDWLVSHVEVVGELRAASGPRLGPRSERARRVGSAEEVVTPLLVRPQAALDVAAAGEIFDRPLRRMTVEPASCRDHGSWRTWRATVRTGPLRRRRAALRMMASASGNVTVIELIPERARHFRTHVFVDAGVPALDELCSRLRRRTSA